MDLLRNAYSGDSDEEPEPKFQFQTPICKRPKFDSVWNRTMTRPTRSTIPSSDPPIPGRYVSKRERASLTTAPKSELVSASDASGSISNSNIRPDMLSSLLKNNKAKSFSRESKMAEKMSVALSGHTSAVNAVHWSQTHPHLLASAGMDGSAFIWNPWSDDHHHKMARKFRFHNGAVKDVRWSRVGASILSCGFDCSSRMVDVEKGTETGFFEDDQEIGVVKFHGEDPNVFLSGGSRGRVRLWDVRAREAVRDYSRGREPVLDAEFSRGGKQIIASSDVTRTNVSENSITVWDISRQVPLSNQVYVEAYTCPCVRIHPKEPIFVAQSNGNYVAIFSSNSPFKLNKFKRFEGHGVSGFPVKCNFSSDGEILVSGSSDGFIHSYDFQSSKLVRKIKAYDHACVDVSVHPTIPNVLASCSWNGQVSVFE